MLLGWQTRIAALAAAAFIGFTVLLALPKGWFWMRGGSEYPLMWTTVLLALALAGPGPGRWMAYDFRELSHESRSLDHGRRTVMLASGAAVALGLAGRAAAALDSTSKERRMSTLVIRNARITTLDPQQPHAQALAVQEGRIVAVGSDEEIMRGWGNEATLIDAQGRRLLPGLNDSHTHLIRGGLNYNLELRWDGLRSLGDALDMLKAQVDRTPAPQWVRVVGGFTAAQFNESACRRCRSLTTSRRIRRCSCCTCTTARCSTAPRCVRAATARTRRIRRAGRSCAIRWAIRPGCCWPPNALILYATLAKGHACRSSTRPIRRATSCAN